MGSYKSLNMGYDYSYPTYNPTCSYPCPQNETLLFTIDLYYGNLNEVP